MAGDFNSLPDSSVIDIITHKFNETSIRNKEELNIYIRFNYCGLEKGRGLDYMSSSDKTNLL